MKAILLSAGKGERLRPITNSTPKCLLPIGEKPLLLHWLEKFEEHGINEVLINGHYLAWQVEDFLKSVKKNLSLAITYVYEPELLGTGGTVKKNRPFIEGEDCFFLIHGDNFTNFDLTGFLSFHRNKKTVISVALFSAKNPEQCGIVEEIDEENCIIKFVEKPLNPKTNLASSAMFILSPSVINSFPEKEYIDFSKEVLPLYQGMMYGYKIQGYNIDIGTINNYKLANEIARQKEMKP